MKLFAKISFFIFTFVFSVQLTKAQCTPDPNTPKWTTLPLFLPMATSGVPYTQIMQFKPGADTMINYPPFGNVTATIDSMKIVNVIGLPPGFTYQCNNASCRMLGGQAGCLTLSGTPADKGTFPIKVVVSIWAKVQLLVPIPQNVVDTNDSYTLIVNWPTGLSEPETVQNLTVYPNPSQSDITIQLPSSTQSFDIKISDISGREVKTLQANSGKQLIQLQDLSKGVYHISASNSQYLLRSKLIIQ
jgi:hypothetical protein